MPDNQNKDQYLRRSLKARQLSMIAIGGAIGTGLFVASGASIHDAGPGGALAAYALVGFMVYFLMTSLGEMSAYLPNSGSFYVYSARFVDKSLGFAMGINYWFNWAITVAAEIAAASLIMKFWFPYQDPFMWSVLFWGIFVALNTLSVRGFGEAEYWFSLIKVSTVVIFIIVGGLMIMGLMAGHNVGFQNWTMGDAPFHGGGLALLGVFMIAGFSFQGTELIGVAAGESEDPKRNIPKAVKQVFWRILLFYILTIFIISTLIPYTDHRLINANIETIQMSPFTIVFYNSGLMVAASIMNAVILSAVLSAGNSGMYASTRMLWYLSKQGHGPKLFAKVNKHGVPIYALMATATIGMLAFLSYKFGNGQVYNWLLNASALSGFIAWLGLAISHYRFRRAYLAQGRSLKDLPYLAKGFPYGQLFAIALCIIIIAGQNYDAFINNHITWHGLMVAYISLFIFIVLWLGYKFIHKTKLIPLKECNLNQNDD